MSLASTIFTYTGTQEIWSRLVITLQEETIFVVVNICLFIYIYKKKANKKTELRIPRWLAPGAVFCVLFMSRIVVRGEAGEVLCVRPCFENRIHQKKENY